MRALLDLVFQVRIGLLQLASHVVELVGQRFDFVATFDADALAEVAATDARRAGSQDLDRHHHAPGQEHTGDKRKRHCAEQDVTGAQDRAIKRSIRFFDRRLDKHEPAERIDWRKRRQHLMAANIVRFPHRLARRSTAGAAHLREARHIGIA